MRFVTLGTRASAIITVILLITAIVIIISASTILYKNFNNKQLESSEFYKKYYPLTEKLNIKSKIGVYWKVLILIRWFLTILILVILRDNSTN